MVAFCPTCAEAGKRVPVIYNVLNDHYTCPRCQAEYLRENPFSGKLQPVAHAR
jgi:hypothetical protein